MQLDCPNKKNPLPLRAALLLALLAVAALGAGCPTEGNQGVTVESTPMTGGDDRPIIVTGGSLDIFFNHNGYRAAGGDVFRAERASVKSLRVYDNEKGDENSTPICSKDFTAADSEITIEYKPEGKTPAIVVRNVSGNVEIAFDTSTLKLRQNSGNLHYSKNAKISAITYKDGGAKADCRDLPSNGKVTVEINTR